MVTRPFRRKAMHFCIWRAGQDLNWDCTIADLARATSIPATTVRDIVKRSGWAVKNGRNHTKGNLFGQVRPLDQIIA